MNRAILLAIFAICNIVFASAVIRFCETGPVASGAYRLLLTIPLLVIMNRLPANQTSSRLKPRTLIASCLAGVFFALDLSVFNVSLLYTTLAESNLLTNMVPFVTAPLAIFIFREKIPRKFLISAALAGAGLVLIMHDKTSSSLHLSGDWLAMLSAVFYALFLTSIKSARRDYPAGKVMLIACTVGGCLMLAIAAFKHETLLPLTWHGYLAVGLLAFNGMLLGQTLFAYAVKFIPLQLSSLLLLLSPLIAELYAYLIFHETLSVIQSSGIIIVLFAVFYGKLLLEQAATNKETR